MECDRRAFLRLTCGAGFGLASALVLTACGGTATPASSPASSAATGAASAAGSGAAAASAAAQAKAPAGWDQVVAAARQEGTVVLGVPPGPQYQPAISAAFDKTYPGIKVEMTNLVASDFTARIAKERAAGQFAWDAWIGGPDVDVYRLAHDGVFDPLKAEIMLPDLLDDRKWLGGSFDAQFSDTDKKLTFNFGASNSEGAFVNRDFIPDTALAKYDDLWKPDFKGKIVWQDPRQSGSGVNQAAVILKLYGEAKLRELWTNQQVTISTDERQMADWVARGVHPIGVGLVRNRGIDLLKQQGVGLNIKSIAAPVPLNIPGGHSLVAINKAPHPNARKVMLNWLLSQEGQNVISQAVSVNSRRIDVPIVDPATQVPKDQTTLNTQAEEFVPFRSQANKIAAELFK
jgi:iron(III) transport system substrate-binding protein